MAEKAADDDDDGSSDGGDDDEDEGAITEIRFVPSDKAACEWPRWGWAAGCTSCINDSWRWRSITLIPLCALLAVESMFSAMCECQALHPDPEDDDSDNDFEGEEYDVEEAGEAKLKRIDAECTWLNVTMEWPVKMGLISVWMI